VVCNDSAGLDDPDPADRAGEEKAEVKTGSDGSILADASSRPTSLRSISKSSSILGRVKERTLFDTHTTQGAHKIGELLLAQIGPLAKI